MMTAKEKERYDTLIDTIHKCLKILKEDFGTAFVLAISTDTSDKQRICHTGCACENGMALVLLKDIVEDIPRFIEPIKMINDYISKEIDTNN